VAALLVLLLGIGIWLVITLLAGKPARDGQPKVAETAPIAGQSQPGILPATVPVPGAPIAQVNSLGQPLDEDGRVAGPSKLKPPTRNAPMEKNGLPLPPPLFDDPNQRAQFRAWWIDQFVLRARIYTRMVPGDHYPSDGEAEKLFTQLYDLSEPQRPDESADAYRARSGQLMRDLYPKFRELYGDTPYTIQSRASDPSNGPFREPPVQPPGSDGTPGLQWDPLPPKPGMRR
jgi:hypothetical protein